MSSKIHNSFEEVFVYDAKSLGTSLDKYGLAVIRIDPSTTEHGTELLRKCIARMFELKEKDPLSWLDNNRKGGMGLGNVGTGIICKQMLTKDDYPVVKIMDESQSHDVAFDVNRIYSDVLVPMLAHSSMAGTLSLIREYLGDGWHLSPDFAKSVTGEKVSGATRVKATPPHRDMYSEDRLQGMINNDGKTKLFFVPCSNRNIGEYARGFKRCEVDVSEAIAPPPNSYTIWKKGVIHFEGVAKSNPELDGMYRCQRIGMVTSKRLRFYLGFQKNLSQDIMKQLARYAMVGACPAFYNGINRGTIINPLIVCRKTTRAMKSRELSNDDLHIFEKLAEMQANKDEMEDPLPGIEDNVRWLYGLC